MDDIAIHTRIHKEETEQQHLEQHHMYVQHVLAKLQEHNLFLKPEKCTFEQLQIEFLRVTVNQGTVQMDDKKVEKVKNWQQPINVTKVQRFLGFTEYY